MKIVFLDVDGVLNSKNELVRVYNETHKPHSGYNYPFDKKCLYNLRKIITDTDSKIVITSTWRKDEEGRNILNGVLKLYGLDKYVIGYTPILDTSRGEEIKQYLLENKCDNFVILDDDSDMGELTVFLIKTNRQFGLTDGDAQKAIKKLNKKNQ